MNNPALTCSPASVQHLSTTALPSPYTTLSPLNSWLIGIALLLMVVILILGLRRTYQNHRRLQRVREHVDQSVSRLPDVYNSRPLIEALIPRYFDVPDNFLNLPAEPNFSVARLSWFLGLLDILSSDANLYYGDLHPNAHPRRTSNIFSPEFWLDFEYEGACWAIWFPDDGGFEVIDRRSFSNHISTIRSKRPRAEIMSWMSRYGRR